MKRSLMVRRMCAYNCNDGPHDLLRKEETHPAQMPLECARALQQQTQPLFIAFQRVFRNYPII